MTMRQPKQIIGEDRLHQLLFEGYVVVPIKPTKEMIEAAWADALAEDAAGVWEAMIKAVPGEDATHKGE